MPSFGAPNRMPTSVSRNKGFTRMPGNSVVLATDKERLKILSVSRTSIQLLLEAADNLAALPGMRDGAPRLGVINLYWGAERPLTWPGGDRPRAVALLLRAVCRHVGANPKTLVIDLKSLPVPSPVWVQLAAALRHTPSPSTGVDVHQLQQLRLAGCSLGNGGCRSVCRALCRLPHVGLVDLTDCDLDADAAPALGKLIRDHSVRRTNRHYDKCTAEWAATLHPVEGPGIKWCAAASSSQQPGSPYTTDNPQHQRPVPSSKSGSVLDDGRPAGLSTLLLAHNRLGDSGAHALAPYIARDNFLATLDVSHNGVGPAAAAAIRTAAAYRHERGIGTRLELKADGIPGDRPLAAQRKPPPSPTKLAANVAANVAAVDGFRSAAARGKLDPKAAAALVKACGGKQAVYDALEMTLTRSAEALLGQRSKSVRAEWSKTPGSAPIAKASATPSHPRPGKLNFESTKRRPMSARQ